MVSTKITIEDKNGKAQTSEGSMLFAMVVSAEEHEEGYNATTETHICGGDIPVQAFVESLAKSCMNAIGNITDNETERLMISLMFSMECRKYALESLESEEDK